MESKESEEIESDVGISPAPDVHQHGRQRFTQEDHADKESSHNLSLRNKEEMVIMGLGDGWVMGKGYECNGGTKKEQEYEVCSFPNVVRFFQLPTEAIEEDNVEEEREAKLAIEEKASEQPPHLKTKTMTCPCQADNANSLSASPLHF